MNRMDHLIRAVLVAATVFAAPALAQRQPEEKPIPSAPQAPATGVEDNNPDEAARTTRSDAAGTATMKDDAQGNHSQPKTGEPLPPTPETAEPQPQP